MDINIQELIQRIESTGDEIRKLKKDKTVHKDKISLLIQNLLNAKAKYRELTGKDFGNKNSTKQEKKTKEKNSSKKSKNQLKQEKKLGIKKDKKLANKFNEAQFYSETARPLRNDDNISIYSDQERMLHQSKFMHQFNGAGGNVSNGQSITPWDVQGDEGEAIDYDKLIAQFGCSPIDTSLISRLERLTGHKAHRYLRRGYFFSHRDLDQLLDSYEKGEKFYLYTGRGPSSGSLHMGHLIPFTFTAWLQKVFQVPLVIQLTDDEKFLFKDQTLDQSHKMMWENAKDIIACGFDVEKTFIFSNTQYISNLYPDILKVQKCVTYNQVRGIFGFTGTDNIGKSAFPAVQAVPSFSSCFEIPLRHKKNMRCLIPQAIDQDPYFRMTRDVAPRIGYIKPALIHSKFFPALQGSSTKMSASSSQATIFMSDSPEEITTKIKKYAFSGGGETRADHELYGANLEVDIPFQYLSFLLEDDNELKVIADEYGSGRMMSGQVKERLIHIMCEFNSTFQNKRSQVTDDVVKEFMRIRQLNF